MDAENNEGLVIRNHHSRDGSSLPNQGQIDWIALANTTVSASVGFLSRMSNAGVDPFTVAVGQAIASKFQMSRVGMHRLETAIKSLHGVAGFGETLWFGFGINHVVRSMTQTTEGATCLMLCSALSETRSTPLAARVLFELTKTYSSSSPEAAKLTPSLQQWDKLVQTSVGCLSCTPFGTIVDKMVGMVYSSDEVQKHHRRLVGNPEEVAAALNALAKLSNGKLTSLTISGGFECGWLAAVAYWFFDIAVEFRDHQGLTVYPMGNTTPNSSRSLVILQSSESSAAIKIYGEAYLVTNVTAELINRDEENSVFGGVDDIHTRVPWESLLRLTFGKQASTLLRLKMDFGTAVGSAARMFSEFVRPETDVWEILQRRRLDTLWYAYGPSSYGSGFIHFLCATFPETASLRNFMEEASQRPFPDAVAAYQTAHERLRSVCSCARCRTGTGKSQYPCLPMLCGFVIRLSIWLSVTTIPQTLLPCRSGLERTYCTYEYMMAKSSSRDPSSKLFESMRFGIAREALSTIFTGLWFRNDDMGTDHLAFVKHGVCSYLGILKDLSDEPEQMLRIYLIPGRIETKTGRSYDWLYDSAQFGRPSFSYDALPVSCCTTIPDKQPRSKERYEVHAVVEENISRLTMYFLVLKDATTLVACRPWLIISRLLTSCGSHHIQCSRHGCADVDISGLGVAVTEGEGKLEHTTSTNSGCRIILRRVGGHSTARALALLIYQPPVAEAKRPSSSQNSSGPPTHVDEAPDGTPSQNDEFGPSSEDADSRRQALLEIRLRKIEEYQSRRSSSTEEQFMSRRGEPEIIMQRDECLPCTIRKAVELSQNSVVYVICS